MSVITLLRRDIEVKLLDVSNRLNASHKTTDEMRSLITERKRLLTSIEFLNRQNPAAN
jgi:hypothetical protein